MNNPKTCGTMLKSSCCAAVLACFALVSPLMISSAWAALAEPPTVLYYLVEMQRRAGKGCAGEAVTLPALTPDRGLEDIAEAATQEGQTLSGVLAERGLAGKVFGARFSAPTPQAGVQFMREKYCESVMHPQFTRIGGTKHGNQWVVLMAGDNAIPDPVLVAPDGSTTPVPQDYTPMPGGQSVAPETSPLNAQPHHGNLPDGFSPSEMEPADSQVTGVYSNQRGQFSVDSRAPAATQGGFGATSPPVNRPNEPASYPLAPPPGMEPAESRPTQMPYTPQQIPSGTAPASEGQPMPELIPGQNTGIDSGLNATGNPPLATPEQGGYLTSPTPQTDAEDIEQARRRLGPDRSPTEALPAEPQVTGEYTYGPAR